MPSDPDWASGRDATQLSKQIPRAPPLWHLMGAQISLSPQGHQEYLKFFRVAGDQELQDEEPELERLRGQSCRLALLGGLW